MIKTTAIAVHVVHFSAAHYTQGADPTTPEAHMHGHRYRAEFTSGKVDTEWWRVDEWVKRYLTGDLTDSLRFTSTPVAIAAYLLEVFSQLDDNMLGVTLIVDDGDRVSVMKDADVGGKIVESVMQQLDEREARDRLRR